MRADKECYACCVNKAVTLLEQYDVPEHTAAEVLERIRGRLRRAGEDASAPVLMAQAMRMLGELTGIIDAFDLPKKKYNELLLRKEEAIFDEVMGEEDSFSAALQYAITGNYIDFGAMAEVEDAA